MFQTVPIAVDVPQLQLNCFPATLADVPATNARHVHMIQKVHIIV